MTRNLIILGLIPILGACVGPAAPAPSTGSLPAPVMTTPSPTARPPSSAPSSVPPRISVERVLPSANLPVPRGSLPRAQPPRSTSSFQPPKIMNVPGLEEVIGADSNGLQRLFGLPRLNVIEGNARKLQFVGTACVLDVYLYPLREGAQPTATYVDARRYSDGLDVDRASCVAALKRSG